MSEHIGAAIHERDAFVDACEQIFGDCGLTFSLGRANDIIPRPVHARIDPQRPGFVIVPLSLQERAKLPQRNSQEKSEKA